MMNKFPPSSRKADLYDIGNGLTMMNIIIKNEEGKTKRVDTYIGIEGEGFSRVVHSANLDQLGVIYSYFSHVQQLKAALPFLIEIFNENKKQKMKAVLLYGSLSESLKLGRYNRRIKAAASNDG